MATAREYLEVELEDDETEFGGIAFFGETLADFMSELSLRYSTPISKVNTYLHQCGIKPIKVL